MLVFNMKICTQCVLPESLPSIELDADGVCNICRISEKEKKTNQPPLLETEFVKILEKSKGKGKYDCLVMCSGGKDSTAALYYMKKRYRTNPLAFSFDHGFEPDEALDNVKRAVDILHVDFLFYKSSYMHDLFAEIIKLRSKAVICHLCSIWYMDLTLNIAQSYGIPIIIAGWTKGQLTSSTPGLFGKESASKEFMAMSKETKDFIKNLTLKSEKYKNFPSSIEEIVSHSKKIKNISIISPHWFLPYTNETYSEMIKKELNWREISESYPKGSTNCRLNFASVYLSMKHYGYTHYHVEMSKLIRQGLLSREEALKKLDIDFKLDYVNEILSPLQCKIF